MKQSAVFRVWRQYPAFARLQYSNILTNFVGWGSFIAMLALLTDITRSGIALGVLWSVSGILPLICNAFIGVWVDRLSARTSFPVVEALQGVVTLGFLLVPVVHGVIASYGLFLLTRFLLGILGSWSNTARQVVIPDLIPRDDLTTANSLNFTINSIIRLTGASFGGVFLTFVSLDAMWIISSLSFFVSAWWIWRAVRGIGGDKRMKARTGIFREWVDGLRVVATDPWVLMVILTDVAAGVLVGSYNLMLQLFVRNVYHAPEYAMSLLYVSEGLLSAITGYILANLRFLFRTRAAYAVTYAFTGLLWMAFGMTTHLALGMLCLALYAIAASFNIPYERWVMQTAVPGDVRGRVFGMWITTSNVAIQIGAFLTGVILSTLGDHAVPLLTGALRVLAGVVFLALALRDRTPIVQAGTSAGSR